MIIESGDENSYKAKVDNEGRLRTLAITESLEHHVNAEEGAAFHLLFEEAATAINDVILYIKNSDSRDLIIEGLQLMVNSPYTRLDMYIGDTGTPSGTTTLTPINCNAGSGNAADGNFYGGTDITGLTAGSLVHKQWISGASNTDNYNFELDVVIPKNQVFTIRSQRAGVYIVGTVPFYFHD